MQCAISGLQSEGLRSLRRASRFAVCLIVMSLLSACSPLTLVNLTSPNYSQTRVADVTFDEPSGLTLDLYHEPRSNPQEQATLLFFYGGSWQRGSKDQYRFVASRLTPLGYRVIVANYRLYPEVTFPAFMDDAARAYAWATANVARYGGDPGRIYLVGHSAGAHIAALLHYDDRYRQAVAPEAPPPAGLIGLSGPYDFLPITGAMLKRVFPESVRDDSQPVRFANARAGSALLLHGDQDETVRPGNSVRLARAVINAGGTASYKIYPSRGHAGVLLAMTRPLSGFAPVIEDIAAHISGGPVPGASVPDPHPPIARGPSAPPAPAAHPPSAPESP